MSKLEKTIVSIMELFEEYAETSSHKQMSNTELSSHIMKKLRSHEFQSRIDQEDICEALRKIDRGQDGQVNFEEFSQSVAILAQGYVKDVKGKDKAHH
ncbi:S100 calcium binding protein W [Clarias gariepinus]|uniref:S100 calcium binding protein W n=1 Tax=Clarias gariepinus TaxID=13013 RepID=UPI00234C6067|nr:S100 calcium binding protein W [Clarias gariepinus]